MGTVTARKVSRWSGRSRSAIDWRFEHVRTQGQGHGHAQIEDFAVARPLGQVVGLQVLAHDPVEPAGTDSLDLGTAAAAWTSGSSARGLVSRSASRVTRSGARRMTSIATIPPIESPAERETLRRGLKAPAGQACPCPPRP